MSMRKFSAATAASAVEPLESRTLMSAGVPQVAPRGSIVGGQTLAAWSVDWWHWALETPTPQNPLVDETGANAGVGQPRGVFFLAGNFGGSTVRTATITTGTRVFFPVMNYFATEEGTLRQMRQAAAAAVAHPQEVHAKLDGTKVGGNILAHREVSPVFALTLPADNILGASADVYSPTISDGYWLMLAPLSRGQHTINFGGTSSDGAFALDVTYHIDVVPKGQQHNPGVVDGSVPAVFGSTPIKPKTRLADAVLSGTAI